MKDEIVKGITSTTQVRSIQKDPKERDFLSKKKKQMENKEVKPSVEENNSNYVNELKTVLMYGDIGHGILIDKKI
jgi:hypothetical protein